MTTSCERNSLHLVEVTCPECGTVWHLRAAPDRDLAAVTSEEEVEHFLNTDCRGHLSSTLLGECSPELDAVLSRETSRLSRFDEFRREETGLIHSRRLLLGVPSDKAAAVLFAEREVAAERERLGAPHDVVLGLGATLVLANCSANICVQPQLTFIPDHLEVPPSVADHFLVTDIKVNHNSVLDSTGAVPAWCFSSHRHQYLRLKMDVAQASMFITVSVTNASDRDQLFTGAVVGHVPPTMPSTSLAEEELKRLVSEYLIPKGDPP